jgi:hypothetical protein
MEVSGTERFVARHKSIVGAPLSRALTHVERFETSMLRGLIRSSALDVVGGLQVHDFESFGSDHRFMTELALAGEFRFVPGPTYYKRLHGKNLHLKWYGWPEERKRAAWVSLAAQILEALVPAGASGLERWHLLYTVLDRFLVSRGGDRWMFCAVDDEDAGLRATMLAEILERVRQHSSLDLPSTLAATWPDVQDLAAQRFGAGGPPDGGPQRS